MPRPYELAGWKTRPPLTISSCPSCSSMFQLEDVASVTITIMITIKIKIELGYGDLSCYKIPSPFGEWSGRG